MTDPGQPGPPHLGVVGDRALRYCALFLYQEAEPSPLFRESCLVAVGDVVFQLALLVADGLDVLEREEAERWLPSPLCPLQGRGCRSILRRGVSGAALGLEGGRQAGCPQGPPSTGDTHTHVCPRGASNPPLLIGAPPRRGADSARGPGAARAAGRAVPRAAALSPNGHWRWRPGRLPPSPRAGNGPHSPWLIPARHCSAARPCPGWTPPAPPLCQIAACCPWAMPTPARCPCQHGQMPQTQHQEATLLAQGSCSTYATSASVAVPHGASPAPNGAWQRHDSRAGVTSHSMQMWYTRGVHSNAWDRRAAAWPHRQHP